MALLIWLCHICGAPTHYRDRVCAKCRGERR